MPNQRILIALTLLTPVLVLPSVLRSQSYPIKVERSVRFESLSVSIKRVSLELGKGALGLIECEPGITGVVLLASGSFTFATNDTQSVHDTFTNGLLRFNPSDYASLFQAAGAKPDSQAELIDQAMKVIQRSFVRLYHRGNDASIPPVGVLGAVLYTDHQGDIIISEGGEKTGVYSITGRRVLTDGGPSPADPSFQEISKNWLPKVNRQGMDRIWQKEGIVASGDNYFYFPATAEGKPHSQRFDPASKYFQSWFGVYVVKEDEHGKYGIVGDQPEARKILRLVMTDQRAWLTNFAGMESAVVALDEQTPVTCMKASVAGFDGWKITARLLSNADVGDRNPESGRPVFLLPQSAAWNGEVTSYTRLGLEVVLYVLPVAANKETYVVYYNGVDFVDKQGKKHRTLPEIQNEMESMAGSLRMVKK